MQRSKRTVRLKKEHADRDHIHRDTNKKQLFALWWWCFVANVSDPNKTENYHMESGLCTKSNYELFSHAMTVGSVVASSLKFCADIVVPRYSIRMTLVSCSPTITGWNAIKFGTYIHIPLGMNFNNSVYPQNLYLVPSPGQTINLSKTSVRAITCKTNYIPINLGCSVLC